MAEVASVYSVEPYIRTVDDIINDMASIRLVRPSESPKRPRPINKRVWASVEREMAEVIDEGFREALRRDPKQRRRWVVLVDGQSQQLAAIEAAAKQHGVKLTRLSIPVPSTSRSAEPTCDLATLWLPDYPSLPVSSKALAVTWCKTPEKSCRRKGAAPISNQVPSDNASTRQRFALPTSSNARLGRAPCAWRVRR